MKARKKRRSCDPKQGRFRTREDALLAITALTRKTGSAYGQMQPYRCTYCWLVVGNQRQRPWHFGHRRGLRNLGRNRR